MRLFAFVGVVLALHALPGDRPAAQVEGGPRKVPARLHEALGEFDTARREFRARFGSWTRARRALHSVEEARRRMQGLINGLKWGRAFRFQPRKIRDRDLPERLRRLVQGDPAADSRNPEMVLRYLNKRVRSSAITESVRVAYIKKVTSLLRREASTYSRREGILKKRITASESSLSKLKVRERKLRERVEERRAAEALRRQRLEEGREQWEEEQRRARREVERKRALERAAGRKPKAGKSPKTPTPRSLPKNPRIPETPKRPQPRSQPGNPGRSTGSPTPAPRTPTPRTPVPRR